MTPAIGTPSRVITQILLYRIDICMLCICKCSCTTRINNELKLNNIKITRRPCCKNAYTWFARRPNADCVCVRLMSISGLRSDKWPWWNLLKSVKVKYHYWTLRPRVHYFRMNLSENCCRFIWFLPDWVIIVFNACICGVRRMQFARFECKYGIKCNWLWINLRDLYENLSYASGCYCALNKRVSLLKRV